MHILRVCIYLSLYIYIYIYICIRIYNILYYNTIYYTIPYYTILRRDITSYNMLFQYYVEHNYTTYVTIIIILHRL